MGFLGEWMVFFHAPQHFAKIPYFIQKNEMHWNQLMYGVSIFGHYFYSHRATKLSKNALSEQQIQLLQCQEHFLWIHKLKKTVGSLKQFNKKQTHAWMNTGVEIKKQQSSEKQEQHKTVPRSLSVSFKDMWYSTCKWFVRRHLVLMLIRWHNHPKIARVEFRMGSIVMVLL